MIRINGTDYNSTINQQGDAIGTYVLADNPNLYEIQRTNNFEFIATGLESLVRAGTNQTIQNAQGIIRMSVVSAPIPHFKQNVITIQRGNSTMKAAGVASFDSGTLVVNDYIGADTKSVLMAWQNLSYNVKTEKVGLMSDYKKDCTLIEYTPDYQKVRSWKLYGCWISGLSESDYNNEQNEKHQITATIEYDKAVIETDDI